VLDEYGENNPALVKALGWASADEMRTDENWLVVKDSIGIALAAHIRSQLAAGEVEPPPDEDLPPPDEELPPPDEELPPPDRSVRHPRRLFRRVLRP